MSENTTNLISPKSILEMAGRTNLKEICLLTNHFLYRILCLVITKRSKQTS